jgi:hypothetical protein
MFSCCSNSLPTFFTFIFGGISEYRSRYLKDGSFPQEGPLRRICNHFNTDARILLQPIREINPPRKEAA